MATTATDEDDDTGEATKPATNEFQQLLAALAPGDASAQQKSGVDPTIMLMMKMDQDRAAREREAKDAFWSKVLALAPFAVPIIEKLFGKKEDPILMKLLETLGSGKQMQDFMQMQMALSSKAADMQAATMERAMASADAVREKSMERAMEMIEERASKNDDDGDEEKSKSGTADIIREVRLGLASLPALAAAVKPGAAPVAVAPPVPAQQPAVDVPKIPLRPPPTLIALNVMRQMQTGEIPKERHRSLHGKLAGTVMEDPVLAGFIVNDDLAGLIAHITPLIQAPGQEPLALWAQAPETLGWFESYVRTKLQPLVRMLMEAAPATPPEPIQGPGADPMLSPLPASPQIQGNAP